MAEPKYITEVKQQMGVVQKSITETEKAIVRIDTTLSENLPEMKEQLEKLNGTVRQHDKDLALQKQAHEDCPARKALGSGNPPGQAGTQWVIDLSDKKTKAAVGGLLGAPTLLLLLEIAKLAAQHFWGG